MIFLRIGAARHVLLYYTVINVYPIDKLSENMRTHGVRLQN